MKAVWKWQLETTDDQHIEAPDGAQILKVEIQHDIPCLWMLVDPEAKKRSYHIKTAGTGHPIEFSNNFIFAGTYQLAGGNFIGHVFVA